ncbi:MAG TPA: histidine kinase, partial [Roseiflexaceae bacterium]|nr:histidine kinase [Roseiflexaceae bacterium]
MHTTDVTTVDSRIIAAMRVVLALSALVITVIDPAEPDRLVAVTYTALGAYALYSLALYYGIPRFFSLQQSILRWAHWIDVGWYTLLIALSSGTSSIFFFFFFFAILVASFRHGYRAGLAVVAASVMLFTLVGFVAAPKGEQFELNRFLLRPMYLGVLGYMMAYWGGFEITLKRRLALLRDVNTLANPRFGVDRTTAALMARVRSFYNADTCLLVSEEGNRGEYGMRRAERCDPERAMRVEPLPPEMARQLLSFPADHAMVYSHLPDRFHARSMYHAFVVTTHARTNEGRELAGALAASFDAASFMSAPLRSHQAVIGRLYLIAARAQAFNDGDLDFLVQVLAQFMPAIENIRLVDRLASDAAERERQRIAHDLHDSVIQPYFGLQFGLVAVSRKLEAGNTNVAGDITRLIDQIGVVIDNLRGYMRLLKSPGGQEQVLLSSIRRFVDTFSATSGIDVQLKLSSDIQLSDRLAAEVFQMVAEGLSNIRRHTQAMHVVVLVTQRDNHLVL